MSKEIYISTTPHETRLAVVEDEQLAEIYFERENEYTLAGSIYNGKVTRVLPGMQSSFVDIGLERDAFLYVTDFMEEQGDAADFEAESGTRRQQQVPKENSEQAVPRERNDRGDRSRPRKNERRDTVREVSVTSEDGESTVSFDEPIAPAPNEAVGTADANSEAGGSRRWRGRRGRRRGRSSREEQQPGLAEVPAGASEETEFDNGEADVEEGFVEGVQAADSATIEIDLSGEPAQPENSERFSGRGASRGGRGRDRRGHTDRDRGPRRDSAERPAPQFDNSYAGYLNEEVLPEATGEAIVLPGESIRKYRDPAEVAAEEDEARRNAPAQPEILSVSAPPIEIVGWDGGSVLPGETLGRNRNRGRTEDAGRSGSRSKDRGQREVPREVVPPADSFDQPAPVPHFAAENVPSPILSEEDFPAAIAPEEPAGMTEHPAHGASEAAVHAAANAELGTLPGELSGGEHVVVGKDAPSEMEYEPVEGASASMGDTGRRDLRRLEQTAEAEPAKGTDPAEELAGGSPDPTTYDLDALSETAPAYQDGPAAIDPPALDTAENPAPFEPEFTTLQASGEMISLPVDEAIEQHAFDGPAVQDEPQPANPIEHEGAVQSVTLAEAETTPEPVDGSDDPEGTIQPEIHAYGDGDFHEEEMDEEPEADDYEYAAALGLDENEAGEYEEETLDGTADLGSMIQDLTQDTRELDAEEEDDEEEVESASGGFTEADFAGEPDEEASVESGTGTNNEPRPRREEHRRPGNGRDRRGGRNSGGDRGRGRRQSMQTTDLPAINELLKPDQEILVQIAKEPIAKKGARITSHIALPGRFLVFMPTVNHTGVSRKISSDEERRRLKSILLSEKGDAQGGFIVRTAADGASEEELRNDLRFLIHLWTDIKMRSESSKSPALIYHDLNLVERILRDQVTDNFSAIWVDTEQEYERVLRFLQRFQPSLVRRVKLYTKETPLFEHFGVTQEIDRALKSKVWLKSGGSIVINQTEALVAIDINTGKYVGKTARLEDTILKTNLDAIPEIVRQIRLRDLGGIIVIDFIDMDERKNRAKVMQVLEDAMHADRAPSKILPFNDFGLVIMTRKRVKQSLERTLCIPDPITEGTGMIKSPITIANEIYVEMRKMHRHLEKTDVLLRVHPEVVKTLKANGGKRLQELEEMTRKTILVKSDPALSPEAFDIH